MKSIVLIGDSVVAREYQDGVTALRPRLAAAFPERHIICYASGGTNSAQSLEVTRHAKFPRESAIIISLGMNDVAAWKRVPLGDFRSNYRDILRICSVHRVIVVTPYPVNPQKQQKPGRSNTEIKKYADAAIALAKQHNVGVIDLFNIVSKAMASEDVHVADGVHLNNAGYELFFAAVLEKLAGVAAKE